MNIDSTRPKISETSYRFFNRQLHPELFNPAVTGRIRTSRFSALIGICEGGHFLQVSSDGKSITEITSAGDQVFSANSLQQTFFFNNEEEILFETKTPLDYHFAGQVDAVDPTVFTRVQLELEMAASKAFISQQFPAKNRILPGPLSLIQVSGSERMLIVHSFHTYPEELVVLRTQTLVEFP
ncbi:DUF2617 family protein [Planctomicrobium sp. SH668]|uniref:DUF2617 family protein n=1 Tax=Planctomicrobium sp. SH668 TaxID=3448126 RepID=UPI003F5B805B